ncbi:Lrp/AsnC family transcriptional regulator [Canibacter zhoujuaniae]|uniref:Lrp/AsnC family transcriptional regulator n=1 Tax=Canibacter zhoujuaniae TaxID=2708343 RepID=UPI001423C1BA|nr:AsnC family transcriptional regulator [Canibacter zhoujuaniae]
MAALDPGYSGDRVLAHHLVTVNGPTAELLKLLKDRAETVFVSSVTGSSNVVVESRLRTEAELQLFLEYLRGLPRVQRVKTNRYLRVVKGFFVAEYRGDITLDERDRQIVDLLQTDGRMNYRTIANKVNLSPSAVRARVNRMVEANVIRISAVEERGVINSQIAIGLGISLCGPLDPVLEFLRGRPEVDFATTCSGSFDLIVTVTAATPRVIFDFLEALRATGLVGEISSWLHINTAKEDYARSLREA